jgi:hypothetical protein
MGSYSSKKRFTVLGHSVVFNCVQIDLLKKANFFGVLFNMALVYSDLICETPQIGKITGLNQVFKLAFEDQGNMEGQEGLEPSTPCLRGRCSNQLSYWSVLSTLTDELIFSKVNRF